MSDTVKLSTNNLGIFHSSDTELLLNQDVQNKVQTLLLDKSYYPKFMQYLYSSDEPHYEDFNDMEMLYLFIHQEKDQDPDKNRQFNTKQEYIRDLLQVYLLFLEQKDFFELNINKSIFKSLNEKHIYMYQKWLSKEPLGKGNKPYSVATISRKTTIFKSFLHYLYKKNFITKPLHNEFIAAKVGVNDRPNRDITETEVIELLQYFKTNPIMHGFLSVFITTGARVQELCTAKVSDLTYDQAEGNYWLEVVGKGNKRRSLLIHDSVYESIVQFRKRRGLDTEIDLTNHTPLFTTAKGVAYKYKNLSMYITKRLNEADIPFVQKNNQLKEQAAAGTITKHDKKKILSLSPHTLRHGFAIISANNDSDIYRIKQTLGHKKIETTEIYLEQNQSKGKNVGHAWKGHKILGYI